MSNVDLDKLFPSTAPIAKHVTPPSGKPGPAPVPTFGEGRSAYTVDNIPTRWAAIFTMECRGLNKKEIAEQTGLGYGSVINITLDERYMEYRDKKLASLDREFFAMKPIAMDALRKGLSSADENTALRAAEQWFKGASFGGYSKRDEVVQTLTAEDVAAQLLNAVQVNVQVNVNTVDGEDAA